MAKFHPDLTIARIIPPISFGPRSIALLSRRKPSYPPAPDDMLIESVDVPGPPHAPAVPVRIYRSRTLDATAPALLWMHGGGMISGSPLMDERTNIAFARTLGITVVSVDYRFAPQHPAPAALEDCYAVLRWMTGQGRERGIDPDRIAIGGSSAGGGLAAGVALLAHDRGEFAPSFQLLVYPMLDDRTVARTDHDVDGVRMWSKKSNRYAWTCYLGDEPGRDGVSPYAAPARREDLSGLPPAWVGVGAFDLFHDESVQYATRLREAGVPCDLTVVEGAFHGFDAVLPNKTVSQEFHREQVTALRHALFPTRSGVDGR